MTLPIALPLGDRRRSLIQLVDSTYRVALREGLVTDRPGLASGLAGALVFVTECCVQGYGFASRQHASELANRLVEMAAEVNMPHHFGDGLAGVLYALRYAGTHLIPGVVPDLSDVDCFLKESLTSGALDHYNYDFMVGPVGIGAYALSMPDTPLKAELLGAVVDWLWRTSTTVDGHIGWLTAEERKADEKGRPAGFNLGVAHGLPGVAALLAGARQCVESQLAAELLDSLLDTLNVAQRATSVSLYPYRFGDLEEQCSRLAWCYGDAGIAGAFLYAARFDARFRKLGISAATRAAAHPEAKAYVVDAPFCHGSAGLVAIFSRVAQVTGDARFADSAAKWLRRLVDGYVADAEGLQELRYYEPKRKSFVDLNPGVLIGVSGIGLAAMLALRPDVCTWKELFFLP